MSLDGFIATQDDTFSRKLPYLVIFLSRIFILYNNRIESSCWFDSKYAVLKNIQAEEPLQYLGFILFPVWFILKKYESYLSRIQNVFRTKNHTLVKCNSYVLNAPYKSWIFQMILLYKNFKQNQFHRINLYTWPKNNSYIVFML